MITNPRHELAQHGGPTAVSAPGLEKCAASGDARPEGRSPKKSLGRGENPSETQLIINTERCRRTDLRNLNCLCRQPGTCRCTTTGASTNFPSATPMEVDGFLHGLHKTLVYCWNLSLRFTRTSTTKTVPISAINWNVGHSDSN